MSFEFLNQLPTPADIKRDYPLSPELRELKKHRDLMISDVITGKDSRVLVIIGPCSADNEDSVCDYVSRLTKIQEDVKDQVILVPRIYTNKPRTTGEGYKGICGGGKWGNRGCMIGTIAGLFVFPPWGVLIGPFAGAVIGELFGGKKSAEAFKAGLGAFVGFLFSVVVKVSVCGYFIYSFVAALF